MIQAKQKLTRLLGGECKALAADKRVEQRRFADVGPANECELRKTVPRAVIGTHAALHKICVDHLCVTARVWAQHDVGALKDPCAHGVLVPRIHGCPGRHEEAVERDLDLHLPLGRPLVVGLVDGLRCREVGQRGEARREGEAERQTGGAEGGGGVGGRNEQ